MTLMACYGAAYPMEPRVSERDPSCDLHADLDGDGFCEHDCDDANGAAHPGADDVPGDGIDQDCDGEDAVGNVVLEQEPDGQAAAEPQMVAPE